MERDDVSGLSARDGRERRIQRAAARRAALKMKRSGLAGLGKPTAEAPSAPSGAERPGGWPVVPGVNAPTPESAVDIVDIAAPATPADAAANVDEEKNAVAQSPSKKSRRAKK